MKRFWFGGDSQSGLFDPKRSGKNGFHEGIFDEGFGGFSTLKKRGKRSEMDQWRSKMKRRPEMTSRGIHGDAFTGQTSTLQTISNYSTVLVREMYLKLVFLYITVSIHDLCPSTIIALSCKSFLPF